MAKTKGDMTTQIRERAYALWEQAGHPDGRAVDCWLAAEAQIEVETNGAATGTAQRTRRAATKRKTAAKKAPTSKATARKATKKAVKKKTNGKKSSGH